MAKELNKTIGEPPRLKVPQPGTKPILVVTDDDGQPVLDLPHFLAWHKTTGTFFVGHSEPRAYLKTRDRSLAIMRYRGWVSSHRGKRVRFHHKAGDVTNRRATDARRKKLGMPPFDYEAPASTSLPDHVFWKQVRSAILDDPKLAAKETGINELGYLTDLRPPQPSAKLPEILDAYLNKRRSPSEDEQKKVKRYWDAFVTAVAPAKTVRDVDATALTRWEDKAYAKYNNEGSPKTLAHRFEYVQRLFKYALKKKIDSATCQDILDFSIRNIGAWDRQCRATRAGIVGSGAPARRPKRPSTNCGSSAILAQHCYSQVISSVSVDRGCKNYTSGIQVRQVVARFTSIRA